MAEKQSFLSNISSSQRLAVAQAVASSIQYINAKKYRNSQYRVKRLYNKAIKQYNALSTANRQYIDQMRLPEVSSQTLKQDRSQAYAYVKAHYLPKFMSRVNPKDRLNYAKVVQDTGYLDYEKTQARPSKRVPKVRQESREAWSKLSKNAQSDIATYHKSNKKSFDKLDFQAKKYVRLHTTYTPYKRTTRPVKPQFHQPYSGYSHSYSSANQQKTNTFLDNVDSKDRTSLAKTVIAYENYVINGTDIETGSDLKSLDRAKRSLKWTSKYLSPKSKQFMHQLAQHDEQLTDQPDTQLSSYAKQAQKYLRMNYTPKFLFKVPKSSQYDYASAIVDTSYLDYEHAKHNDSPRIPLVQDRLNKTLQRMPKSTVNALQNFHQNKPKIFNSVSFKARDYLALHTNTAHAIQQQALRKKNLQFAPSIVAQSKQPKIMSQLVVHYTNAKLGQLSKSPLSLPKQETKRGINDLTKDTPLFHKLSAQDQQKFRKFAKQNFNKTEYGVLHDQAYDILNPSTFNDQSKYGRTDAISSVHMKTMKHELNNLRPSIKHRLILQYEKQVQNLPMDESQAEINHMPEEVSNDELEAEHAKVNQASLKKTQQDQAKMGDVSDFLRARARKDQAQKKLSNKGTWSKITKQNKQNKKTPAVAKRPNSNQPTKQQKMMKNRQQGQQR